MNRALVAALLAATPATTSRRRTAGRAPAGVHPKVVQERLGHSNITMTLDLYSHALPGMQAHAAARIAALVDGVG